MQNSYKVGLKGSQTCKAPKAANKGNKKPAVRKGSDLRGNQKGK